MCRLSYAGTAIIPENNYYTKNARICFSRSDFLFPPPGGVPLNDSLRRGNFSIRAARIVCLYLIKTVI